MVPQTRTHLDNFTIYNRRFSARTKGTERDDKTRERYHREHQAQFNENDYI